MDASNNGMSGESFPSSVPSAPPPFPQSAVPQPPVFSAPAGLGAQATEYTQYQMAPQVPVPAPVSDGALVGAIPPPPGVSSAVPGAGAGYMSGASMLAANVVRGGGQQGQPGASAKKGVPRIVKPLIVLGVLVVVGIVGIFVVNTMRSPQAQVRRYVELVASEEISQAEQIVDPDVDWHSDWTGASPVGKMTVDSVVDEDAGSHSQRHMVTANLRVNGEPFSYTFMATNEPVMLGLIDNWTIHGSLATRVVISGATCDQCCYECYGPNRFESGGESPCTRWMYPGVYLVNGVMTSVTHEGIYGQQDEPTVYVDTPWS